LGGGERWKEGTAYAMGIMIDKEESDSSEAAEYEGGMVLPWVFDGFGRASMLGYDHLCCSVTLGDWLCG
jgi:hypothetical protein